MRLNYYQFPETVDVQTRYENGAGIIKAGCRTHPARPDGQCPQYDGAPSDRPSCRDCSMFQVLEAEDTVGGITVTAAKKLLRTFGGSAWTEHLERDGGCFEVTPITLAGNNSKFKYNRHL